MKFVVTIEEKGYELHYWDEINEEIMNSLTSSWDKHLFCETLERMGLNMSARTFDKIIRLLEFNQFVVLEYENNKFKILQNSMEG